MCRRQFQSTFFQPTSNQLVSSRRTRRMQTRKKEGKRSCRMEGRVLSGIEAIEPRIIRTGEQKLAIFERGIGERNYIL